MEKSYFEKLLKRPAESHKYDYGHVLVIAGWPGMVGAAYSSGLSALRVGAGLVTLASVPEVIDKLETKVVEMMTLRLAEDSPQAALKQFIDERKVSVILIGPGLDPAFATKILSTLPDLDLPVVVDGGALAALAQNQHLLASNFILTPHAGEFARFKVDDPASFARQHQLVLVLKSDKTEVFGGEQHYQNQTGNAGMATAGSGDVLAGMIAGLLAQTKQPFESAQAGVYLHGLAGDLAAKQKTMPGLIASDITKQISAALMLVQNDEL